MVYSRKGRAVYRIWPVLDKISSLHYSFNVLSKQLNVLRYQKLQQVF